MVGETICRIEGVLLPPSQYNGSLHCPVTTDMPLAQHKGTLLLSAAVRRWHHAWDFLQDPRPVVCKLISLPGLSTALSLLSFGGWAPAV